VVDRRPLRRRGLHVLLLRGRRAVLRRASVILVVLVVVLVVVIAALVTSVVTVVATVFASATLRERAQAQSRGGDEKSQRERKSVHEAPSRRSSGVQLAKTGAAGARAHASCFLDLRERSDMNPKKWPSAMR
jgi:hypothetical protein